MATIPSSQHTTATQIVRWYESKPQDHRPHMGASIIGHNCERNIWLTWRWALAPKFAGRILRLFDTGKREEVRILEELRGIGAQVWDVNPETNEQWRVSACNGHFGGSLDGVAKGLPEAPMSVAVLEFKTHSAKSFADLVRNKVAASKSQHYDQMNVYMGLMNIDRALYIGINKDTDDIYTEWLHADKDRFDQLMARAEKLIEACEPPPRISEDPAFFVCKLCNFWEHCHNATAADVNCRTCCHASPDANSAWRCSTHNTILSDTVQRTGCDQHLLLPALVPYGEALDGGQGWVAYKHRKTGAMFVNSNAPVTDYGPNFSSKELRSCPGELLDAVADLKNVFPGSQVVDEDPFADIATTDIDSIPTRQPSKVERATKKRNAAFANALEAFANK